MVILMNHGVSPNGGNKANCEDGKSKADCREDSSGDDGNNNVDDDPKMMVKLMLIMIVGW